MPAEPDALGVATADDDEPVDREALLEQMAEVVETYRPDATAAPELFEGVTLAAQAISPQNAFLIQDMMRDVIRRGTGRKALVLGRKDLSGVFTCRPDPDIDVPHGMDGDPAEDREQGEAGEGAQPIDANSM